MGNKLCQLLSLYGRAQFHAILRRTDDRKGERSRRTADTDVLLLTPPYNRTLSMYGYCRGWGLLYRETELGSMPATNARLPVKGEIKR